MSTPLQMLYPHLSPHEKTGADAGSALLDSFHTKLEDSIAAKRQFAETQGPVLVAIATALADTFAAGGRLFTMGNGGSSTDAAHVAVEFMHPVTVGRPA
ncbi:MAG: phosphoheptose isomerase, partial [Myxococcota bacterium]